MALDPKIRELRKLGAQLLKALSGTPKINDVEQRHLYNLAMRGNPYRDR